MMQVCVSAGPASPAPASCPASSYEMYVERVRALAWRILSWVRDRNTREDLTQEVCCHLWERWKKEEGQGVDCPAHWQDYVRYVTRDVIRGSRYASRSGLSDPLGIGSRRPRPRVGGETLPRHQAPCVALSDFDAHVGPSDPIPDVVALRIDWSAWWETQDEWTRDILHRMEGVGSARAVARDMGLPQTRVQRCVRLAYLSWLAYTAD